MLSLSEDHHSRLWLTHKNKLGLQLDKMSDTVCYRNFADNGDFIFEHNKNEKMHHKCQHNFTSHISTEEYQKLLGLNREEQKLKGKKLEKLGKPKTYVDWRMYPAVTKVKNQGKVGTCWAFSTTGALEGLHAIKSAELLSFSEQQLVDCSTENDGVKGGLPHLALDYTAKVGIQKEEDYVYEEKQMRCTFKPEKAIKVNTNCIIMKQGESELEAAVSSLGPCSVAIDASSRSFQFYSHGVYSDPGASKNLNHAVLAVGYGVMNGKNYWIIKNSWGDQWGSGGYIYMAKEKKQSGLGNYQVVPIYQA